MLKCLASILDSPRGTDSYRVSIQHDSDLVPSWPWLEWELECRKLNQELLSLYVPLIIVVLIHMNYPIASEIISDEY